MTSDPLIQRARLKIRSGKRLRVEATLEMTPASLMAVGGMVSAILVSTALLVGVAVRASRQRAAVPATNASSISPART